VWLITNTISLFFRVFILKAYTAAIWTNIFYAIPLVILAFFIGNKLHKRIPNERFTDFVYMVQLVSGLFSIAGGVILLI
jgi:uncharacterized membrane protein YfcA